MSIRKPSKDTCGECLIYKNKVKYALRSKTKKGDEDIPDDELADEDSALSSDSVFCISDFTFCAPTSDDQSHREGATAQSAESCGESAAPGLTETAVESEKDIQGFGEDEEDLVELIFIKANDHVVQAKIQRTFAQQCAQEAINDSLKEHEERSRCIIMDYAQILALPYHGEEQPGPIYYFSPLAIYILGKGGICCSLLHFFLYLTKYYYFFLLLIKVSAM